MKIVELVTRDEALSLEYMLREYIAFVCSDLKRLSGVSFDEERLIASTLNSIDKVLPPLGHTFVAQSDGGALLGMIFLRKSGSNSMEIKRLYVLPSARGTGAGRALVGAVEDVARKAGIGRLRLDSTKNLTAAIGLYELLGFRHTEPYPESDHFEDAELEPYMVFMEKRLSGG
jgi:ribosomal protein S18 acetylase RimI-like enzyme